MYAYVVHFSEILITSYKTLKQKISVHNSVAPETTNDLIPATIFLIFVWEKKHKIFQFFLTRSPLHEPLFLRVMGVTRSRIQSGKFHWLSTATASTYPSSKFSFLRVSSIQFFRTSKHLHTFEVFVTSKHNFVPGQHYSINTHIHFHFEKKNVLRKEYVILQSGF
jgi:hypothetical protein